MGTVLNLRPRPYDQDAADAALRVEALKERALQANPMVAAVMPLRDWGPILVAVEQMYPELADRLRDGVRRGNHPSIELDPCPPAGIERPS